MEGWIVTLKYEYVETDDNLKAGGEFTMRMDLDNSKEDVLEESIVEFMDKGKDKNKVVEIVLERAKESDKFVWEPDKGADELLEEGVEDFSQARVS
jgi:hypothetical protein